MLSVQFSLGKLPSVADSEMIREMLKVSNKNKTQCCSLVAYLEYYQYVTSLFTVKLIR